MPRSPTTRSWLLLLSIGCSSSTRAADPFGASAGAEGSTPTASSSGGQDASGAGDDTGGAASSEPTSIGEDESHGVLLDVSAPGGGVEPGCAKIDFLFVVDNSGSMADEQQNLVASFAGFVAEIDAIVGAESSHVMAIDSDAASGVTGLCDQAACPGGGDEACVEFCADECPAGCDCTCCGVDCISIDPPDCDEILGAGKARDREGNACGIAGGQRFITDAQPDPAETFACIAEVGTAGNGAERPMEGMVAAVTTLVAPGQCNDGFLRDDAILVVTVITDEDDQASQGGPAAWTQQLVAAKSGNQHAIVALALVGDSDVPGGTCAPGDIDDGASPAPRLREWAESFPFGSWGSVCADDYVDFFHDAVAAIAISCEEFEPPG